MSLKSFRHFKHSKPPLKVANALHVYARLFGYVKQYWLHLIIAGIASMCYSGVDAWLIYSLKPLLNVGLVERNLDFLALAPFLVLGVFVLRGVSSFLSNYYIATASRGVIMKLRQDLFAHLQKLPARYYDHTTSGKLLSILLYAVDQVANASADVLTTAIQSLFLIIGLLFVMLSASWKLTLIYLAIIPLVTVIMRFVSLRIRQLSLNVQESIGDLSHHAEENIEGYKVVRSFEGQSFEKEKFNKATRTNRQREMKIVVSRSLSISAVQLVTACAVAFTLYIATIDIAGEVLSPGGFVSMLAAMFALLKPMKDMANVQNKFYRGLAGAQNVFELLDEPAEIDAGCMPLERAKGSITFKQVSFAYEDKPILHDISFNTQPGEIVALVGRSGSGKSTLVNLLPRFYQNFTGSIELDGVSILDYPLQALRRQFAVVSQQVTLFDDTILNNIAYGCLDRVSHEQILAAAEASYTMEFVKRLPDGLNTLIGENGVLLSGGQRQRIAIARAILKNAPILILDEATSALDTESERFIQTALDNLMKTRTTLIIAHRLSTVEHVDKIIVLDEGKIVEVGSHEELLNQQGHYAKLHRLQFKEPSTFQALPSEELTADAV